MFSIYNKDELKIPQKTENKKENISMKNPTNLILMAAFSSGILLWTLSNNCAASTTLNLTPPSESSIKTQLALARSGNVRAELKLANIYLNKSGLDLLNNAPAYLATMDMNRSRFWAHKAAVAGYPPAEQMMGALYLVGGSGLRTNCSKALFWLHKSAAEGYAPAQKLLDMPSIIGKCE